jgi:hypothetical protein
MMCDFGSHLHTHRKIDIDDMKRQRAASDLEHIHGRHHANALPVIFNSLP